MDIPSENKQEKSFEHGSQPHGQHYDLDKIFSDQGPQKKTFNNKTQEKAAC